MRSIYRFFVGQVMLAIVHFFKFFGYEIVKMAREYSPVELEIIQKVKPFTATSTERITGLIHVVDYLSRNKIRGDFVECGVWRGGSMMAAMLTLKQLGDTSRHFYLYDTYEGMTPPTENDVTHDGTRAADLL